MGQEAGFTNKILTSVGEELRKAGAGEGLTELLTSHGGRHGGAESANEHPDIMIHWLVHRGGWTLSAMQTIFNYIAGTSKTDSRVGRVLSGWRHASQGGVCPSFGALPEDEHDLFALYTCRLLGPAALPQQVSLNPG
jgi:hypothetical protein